MMWLCLGLVILVGGTILGLGMRAYDEYSEKVKANATKRAIEEELKK